MKDFFRERRPHDGLTYEEYLEHWKELANASPRDAQDKSERKLIHYYKYNWKRSQAVTEAYEPSDELVAAMEGIDEPQLWMVLTEPWCGDSAYNLTIIAEAAQLSDQVELRILLRDENLDIMDQYLTEGGRRIPKLVAFDADGRELFQWGARPEGARTLRESLIEQDEDSGTVVQRLLGWYDDGGWTQVDDELAAAVQSVRQAA